MKPKNKKNYWLLCILPFLLFQANVSKAENKEDKTLSPYFKVIGEGRGNLENLPLQDTSAQVDIVGVIADVKVRQVYQNRGETAIEAVYVFPGSTKAAVYGMKMTIGERVVVAKIKERKAAKVAYIEAKKQGKRASLLEQQRPNVFQMNVANIMPGDRIVVELLYTELIVPEQGIYEFVYPAVVGPRYSETIADGAPDAQSWIVNPYLQQDVAPPYTFDIKASVSAGIPIQALSSPSHKVVVDYKEQGSASVFLKNKDNSNGDRDYILRYQLRGQEINTGLLLYKGEEENFFLLMSQPPEKVIPGDIPPREYIFVVDVSGSMHGFPLNTSKNLMAELLSNLRSTDSFNILFFSGGSSVLSETSLPVTKANIEKAIAMMESQRGSGSTRLLPALQRAMALPAEKSTSRSFVMVTDGYVSVEKEAFQYVKDNLNNANFFSFGIGSSINRFLIEGLARAGKGEPFVITSSNESFQVAQRFREYIETPVLTGININFNDFEAYDVEPQKIPDLFAERPLVIYGKWRGNTEGKIEIKGHQGQSDYIQTIDVSKVEAKPENQAIRYLWARNRIAELGDFEKLSSDAERKAEITTLGLTYNLLTEYTSFIAIDEIIANSTGNSQKVKQPLPLPKGISNLAVGGIVPTTPEPGVLNLLAVIVVIFGISLISRSKARKV
ncbi:MAG: VIT domain-containing protein [Methylococcaceae bacterium]